ncbi:MAG TPA: cupin domain-containing protein, partial [Casimicrobium sp.]|nr:cupin domain-containing protein [Casimicrobium sp.]
GERSSISMWKSGIRKHALASGGAASSAFSFTLLDFEPHASSGDDLYTHQGEEAGYVLQGRLKLVVGDKQWTLAAGDSFHFSSELPHRFENAANRNLVVVMVNART